MSLFDAAAKFLGMTLVDRPPEVVLSAAEDAVDRILHARDHPRSGAYRLPTVATALGVPAIQRAVSLISSTTGMLSMQGFRNGVLMDEPPKLITRPDPDQTPYEFYAMTAAQIAKYGEFVWWIATRDGDGNAGALVNVPLNELRVQDNPDNRRFPRYRWGTIVSTRWSPSNPTGQFVHKKYPIGEPFALRGEGPLQLGKIAVSISVESQVWAANFYGGGGHASDIIKHASSLDSTLRDEFGNPDDTGLSEADRLKSQYIARDSNTPLVIDQSIESIMAGKIDEAGAQMLEARLHQNGDAARLFGLPGKFVEYVQSGTSLTYQTLESAFTDLVKTCLQPLYLEPIEQAMSDLLTRSTAARFNVKGFLRADIKTRFEVHGLAIDKGIYDPAYAQREEGILPGDAEYAPIPYAPPQAVPTSIPRLASLTVDWRCSKCDAKLLDVAGPGSRATCRRCKTPNALDLADETPTEQRLEIHNHFPADFVRVDSPVTVHPPDIQATFNAPDPAPMTVNLDMPDTRTELAAVASQVQSLGEEMARMAGYHDDDAAVVRESLAELKARIDAPRKPRRFVPERNTAGQIVGVTEAA